MNTAKRHRAAMDLFDAVCDLPESQRTTRLAQLCGDDPALRREVESLLQHDGAANDLVQAAEAGKSLEILAEDMDPTVRAWAATPDRIGGYRIIGEIGRGGMGIIYQAEQESPRRRVALKVLRPGLVDHDMLKRFQREAHLLGQLQHPGIAQIHEAAVADTPLGRQPFIVMEYVDGKPVDQFASDHDLSTRQRLELMARTCDAVHHAHQKGIIHRDLKPSNVLVTAFASTTATGSTRSATVSAARGFAEPIGQPKVLDFGIARVTDADLQTVTVRSEVGQLIGTLAYMSPEQVSGDSSQVDARCDVYALGVMLYELLAGRRPHDLRGIAIPEAARRIREMDATRLGDIDRKLSGDIETIVAKALEIDRARRYASAAELATDIRRYLSDQPIDARPASTFYQLNKFARRNRGLVAGVAIAFAALTVGMIATTISAMKAGTESKRAQAALGMAKQEEAKTRAALETANEQRRRAEQALEDVRIAANFQGAIIKNIDLAAMGGAILSEIRHQIGDEATQPAISRMMDSVNPPNLARAVIEKSILQPASAGADEALASKPAICAEIHESLGQIYHELVAYDMALRESQAALAIRRAHLGNDHDDTIKSMGDVAHVLINLNRPDEAETLAQEALDRRLATRGEEDPMVLEALNRVAGVKNRLKKYDEELAIAQRAVTIGERVLPPGDRLLPNLQQRLAMCYSRLGRYEDTLALLRKAHENFDRASGRLDRLTLGCLSQIAYTLGRLDRKDESESMYAEVVSGAEQSLGEDDPRTLIVLKNLAVVRQRNGRPDRARTTFEELLKRQRRALPEDHPAIKDTLKFLSEIESGGVAAGS